MRRAAVLIAALAPTLLLAGHARSDAPRHDDESAGQVDRPVRERTGHQRAGDTVLIGCGGNQRRITFAIDLVRPPGEAAAHLGVAEMRETVKDLRLGIQPFVVIANVSDGPKVFGGSCTLAADRSTKRVADRFLANLALPAAAVDPTPALREAFGRPAHIVYVLVDHDWPDHAAVARDVIERANQPWRRCKVNVVVYRGPGGAGVSEPMLASTRTIAEATGGRLRVVGAE
ncbi:MAG TPA: hypothetical protein VF796_07675 [Humisphaera sp.]